MEVELELKPLELGRRKRWWHSPGRVLLVTLLVVVVLIVAWPVVVLGMLAAHFGSGYDDRRFDKLETRFGHAQAAFTKADARMRELQAAHPRAERIGWSQALICVRESGHPESCKPTSPRDRATYGALHGVDVIVRQSKDKGRTFFRVYGDDPPRYTIMRVSDGTDATAYADNHGFRSTRSLESGWTLLGPIPDMAREDAQWQ